MHAFTKMFCKAICLTKIEREIYDLNTIVLLFLGLLIEILNYFEFRIQNSQKLKKTGPILFNFVINTNLNPSILGGIYFKY